VYLVPFPSNRWQYNLLAGASGAGQRVMHSFPIGRWRALGFLRADRVPAVRGIHDVEQNLNLLSELGVHADEIDAPEFRLNDDDRSRATAMLRDSGIADSAEFIAVHAGSAKTVLSRAKRWPPEKYARLIGAIRGEMDSAVVLLEGPDEAGVADEILRGLNERVPVLRLTGPLGDAAGILERARLYLGSDSGLAHLAAAVGTKAVTIFAPADPERVCPFGYRELVVQVNKSCAPCFQYPWHATKPKMLCREPMCIDDVTMEQVMQMVRTALRREVTLPRVPSPSGKGSG
jgi:ADP-heptose:LPS heptosyltransferase